MATTVNDAVNAIEVYLAGEDAQIFRADLGAVVMTEAAVYEVYTWGDEVAIQTRLFQRSTGWEEITEEVFGAVIEEGEDADV